MMDEIAVRTLMCIVGVLLYLFVLFLGYYWGKHNGKKQVLALRDSVDKANMEALRNMFDKGYYAGLRNASPHLDIEKESTNDTQTNG